MSKKTWLYLLPFIIFLMGAVFLFKGLYSDPTKLESVMVDKEVPVFTLQDIYDLGKQHDRSILKGRPMLLNVWPPGARPVTGNTPTSRSWRGRDSHRRHELQG